MNGNVPRTSEGRALSRQEQLLLLLDQWCVPGVRYYVPGTGTVSINVGRERYDIGSVSGAGDRSSLTALVNRGQAIYHANTGGYDITEDGRLRAQAIT